jgi:hypothetical protein
MRNWGWLHWAILGGLAALILLFCHGNYPEKPPQALERFLDPTALFTLGLLIVNVFLAQSTREAALAAKAAADQIPVLERAYIFAAPANIKVDQARTKTTLQIAVDNPGRTPGILTAIYGQYSPQAPLGEEPVYEGGHSEPLDWVINSSVGLNALDSENKLVLPYTFGIDFADPIFFWGYLDYLDVFRKPHSTRFCFLIYPGDGKWQGAGSRVWNDWT